MAVVERASYHATFEDASIVITKKCSTIYGLTFTNWYIVTQLPAGVLGTALALSMARWDINSLCDMSVAVLGLFAAGLAGLFVLAIFTRRPGGTAAVLALLGSCAIQFVLVWSFPMHSWAYAITGIVSCVLIGLVLGTILPERKKSLAGLSIYTLNQEQ